MSVIEDCLQSDGHLLPADTPYGTTFEEIHRVFVENAPFRERRELIFSALTLYSKVVWSLTPDAKLWIDGGFTTHKPWAAPNDADVVVLVPQDDFVRVVSTELELFLALSTLQGVEVGLPNATVQRIQPMAGLVDSFIQPDLEPVRATWHDTWSSVKGQDGRLVAGKRKGYLEVRNS
ncbi:hypothetical protein BLJ79_03535 [Arthrobacter sp. UCD-GKA]|uniref:DUF6932 family protein n=1 Tax=Arthrobacter sp. UCD-GKA TaxID=1913576 RepID=UPI0008DD5586|nr:hypothetical protein [Arthrobacter sp. UCD-GKA]OIH85888.1 hypothetical protein BLJ79_03535 [Arthrobacter sp. UCD-GKA]